MLVTIHNLPSHMRYTDIRLLLQSKCGFTEVILDNLLNESSNSKKVTVGLAEEEDAAILTRNINGLYVEGKQLYVENVRQKKPAEQPFHSKNTSAMSQKEFGYQSQSSNQPQGTNQSQGNYQSQGSYQDQSNYQMMMNQQASYPPFGAQPLMGQDAAMSMMPPGMMGPWNPMYFMQPQNPYVDYTGQGTVAGASSQYSQNSGQQNQMTGSGSDYNRSQEGESRNWYKDNNGTNYDGSQTSRVWQDGSRGRQSSRWGDNNEKSGEKRFRSKSPEDQGGRSYDRRRASPKRTNYGDYGQKDQPRWNDKPNQSSQRQNFGRQETFTSQNSGNFREPDQSIAGINAKLLSLSNNAPLHAESQQGRNNWGRRSSPSHDQGKPQAQSDNRKRRSDDNTYGNSQSNANTSWPAKKAALLGNMWNNSNQNSFDRNRSHPEGSQAQTAPRSADSQSHRVRPLGPQADRPFRPRVDWVPAKQRKAEEKASQLGKNGQGPKSGQSPSSQSAAVPKDRYQHASMVRRDTSFRLEVSAYIVKTMLTEDLINQLDEKYVSEFNGKKSVRHHYLKAIKKAVHSGLEVVLADSIGITKEEMGRRYRQKFHPRNNLEFCKHVLEKTPIDQTPPKEPRTDQPAPKVTGQPAPKVTGQPAPKVTGQPAPKVTGQPAATVIGQPASNVFVVPVQPPLRKADRKGGKKKKEKKIFIQSPHSLKQMLVPAQGKVPAHPDANKQIFKELKQLQKAERDGDENYYRDDLRLKFPLEEGIVQQQAEIISKIIRDGLTNPENPQHADLCKQVLKTGAVDAVRKAVKVNLAKRILDIRSNLAVRVMMNGRKVAKSVVEDYLRRFSVVSLKKPTRSKVPYFVATVSTYEAYDALCNMGTHLLGNETTLVFKPLNVLGPKLSYRERQLQRQKAMMAPDQYSSFGEGGQDDDGEGDDDDDEADEQFGEASEVIKEEDDFNFTADTAPDAENIIDQMKEETVDEVNDAAVNEVDDSAIGDGDDAAINEVDDAAMDDVDDAAINEEDFEEY